MPSSGTKIVAWTAIGLAVAAVVARPELDARQAARPGPPIARRLTRVEYRNTIRDLLHLDVDTAQLLPEDAAEHGFDNVGSSLSISPALMERYLSAARRISRLAVGDATIGPSFASATYDAPQTTFQDARMSEELPFGSRGGLAVRHHFPLDGEYVCRIRLVRNVLGYVRGLGTRQELEVRVDGALLKTFTIGGERTEAAAPLGFTGVIPGDAQWEAYALTADADLDIRFTAPAGPHLIGVSFIDHPVEEEGALQPPLSGLGFSVNEYKAGPSGPWGPAVATVAIDGPYAATGAGRTTSRARLLVCDPAGADGQACARRILSTVVRRAYRRVVTDGDVQALMPFFERGRARSGFEEGIRLALERVLVDPSFLLRVEHAPPASDRGTASAVGGFDVASRLSFFLWSSIPDDELLDAAEHGRLHDPAVLEAQVRRMLADERASALVDNFAAQWLGLRRVQGLEPDGDLFPEFDGHLRDAFEQETRLFVESQIRADASVLDLITANYTFLNERLARHYGIPGVHGVRFRKVVVSGARGGLLGQGSILATTSYPTRTSPVLRGRWVLDNILGTPPPPPPAVIPPLPGDGGSARLTMRARTEQHRRNPACAGCHSRMVSIGFALENFDAVGRWRATDERGAPLDVSAALPDGTRFTGIAGLRTLASARRDQFARTVVKKLMIYALGRVVDDADAPVVEAIVRDAGSADYTWSSLILGIVKSVPFLTVQS